MPVNGQIGLQIGSRTFSTFEVLFKAALLLLVLHCVLAADPTPPQWDYVYAVLQLTSAVIEQVIEQAPVLRTKQEPPVSSVLSPPHQALFTALAAVTLGLLLS